MEISTISVAVGNAEAGFIPFLHVLHSLHRQLLLPVVTQRKIEGLLLAQMHVHLVFSRLQLQLLSALHPLSLQPDLHTSQLVVDVRTDVFLVVGRVVLPDLEVAPRLGGNSQPKFGEEVFFVAQLVGDVAKGGLNAVDDQPREEQAFLEGQLCHQIWLCVVSDPQAGLFDFYNAIGLIGTQLLEQGSFLMLLGNHLQGHDVLALDGCIDEDEIGSEVLVEIVGMGWSTSQCAEEVAHSFILHTSKVQISAIGLCDCLLHQGRPDLNRAVDFLTLHEKQVLLAHRHLHRHEVVHNHVPPDPVPADVHRVDPVLIGFLLSEELQYSGGIFGQDGQCAVEIWV